MLISTFLTALRRIRSNPGFTLINVAGLSIGITSCLFIALFLLRESSFDRFHSKGKRIYRINADMRVGEEITRFSNTPPALGPVLPEKVASVAKSTRMRYCQQTSFTRGVETNYEQYGYFADSSFLEIFDFELLQGNRESALDEPNSIVLSEDLAVKYFERPNVLGEQILINHETLLTVTGILKEVPANSHLNFDYLISFSTYQVPEGYLSDLSSWSWVGFMTYVELNDGADPTVLKVEIDRLFKQQLPYDNFELKANVQPLLEIYYQSRDLTDDLNSHMRYGNPLLSSTLAVVAVMILLIAGFNFTNLASVQAISRSREIGIRKTMGATRFTVVLQILSESTVIVFLSLIMAVIALFLTTPLMSRLTGLTIDLWSLFDLPLVLSVVASSVLFGIASQLYPALLMSGGPITEVLKGILKSKGKKGLAVRNGLLSFQIVLSSTLIVAALVIYSQLDYLQSYDSGFNKENVVIVKLQPEDMLRYFSSLKSVLGNNSNVLGVTQSERVIGEPWPANTILVDGHNDIETHRIMGTLTGVDFIDVMGLNLIEGRSFIQGNQNDSVSAIILNQKAVELLSLDQPIGSRVHYFSSDEPRTVIGVVEDFNFSSLHHEITPMAFVMPFVSVEYMYVRLRRGTLSDQIQSIEREWKRVSPGVPFNYQFMDDHINNLYESESQLSSMVSIFTTIGIGLALVGLFSLTSYTLQTRSKEVAIRKVHGATPKSLLALLSQNFLLIVVVSCLISYPPAYFFLDEWLEQYAYRIDMSVTLFLLSMTSIILLSMVVIGVKAMQIINADPRQILRSE